MVDFPQLFSVCTQCLETKMLWCFCFLWILYGVCFRSLPLMSSRFAVRNLENSNRKRLGTGDSYWHCTGLLFISKSKRNFISLQEGTVLLNFRLSFVGTSTEQCLCYLSCVCVSAWLDIRVKRMSSQKLKPKEDSKTTVSHSKKRRPSSEQPWGNAQRGMTSTSLTGFSRLWSWNYTRATTESMPTCSGKWSWHHHQSATAVLRTWRPNIHCSDAHFSCQQEQNNVWPTAVQLHPKLYGS